MVTPSSAAPATTVAQASSVTFGGEHNACAVRTDGSVRCWGTSVSFTRPKGDTTGAVDVVGACK